jgi:hypothetical protein
MSSFSKLGHVVRLGHVKSCLASLDQVRTVQVMLVHIMPG